MSWQPIETVFLKAPGKRVLLTDKKLVWIGEVAPHFDEPAEGHLYPDDSEGRHFDGVASLWQPLPVPPSD